jgi:hypothetical protein
MFSEQELIAFGLKEGHARKLTTHLVKGVYRPPFLGFIFFP